MRCTFPAINIFDSFPSGPHESLYKQEVERYGTHCESATPPIIKWDESEEGVWIYFLI